MEIYLILQSYLKTMGTIKKLKKKCLFIAFMEQFQELKSMLMNLLLNEVD